MKTTPAFLPTIALLLVVAFLTACTKKQEPVSTCLPNTVAGCEGKQ